MDETTKFDNYCILEIFGHTRIAGRVTEQVIGGQGFIRVDVPLLPADRYHAEQPAFTRLYGPGAIYSITPVSEEIAVRAAQSMRVAPVEVYLAAPQIAAGRRVDGDPDDSELDEYDSAEEEDDDEEAG
jgi:hypothetical protein